jgi:hypothetical protein
MDFRIFTTVQTTIIGASSPPRPPRVVVRRPVLRNLDEVQTPNSIKLKLYKFAQGSTKRPEKKHDFFSFTGHNGWPTSGHLNDPTLYTLKYGPIDTYTQQSQ